MHAFESLEHARALATQWLWHYNNERPNMAIGGIATKATADGRLTLYSIGRLKMGDYNPGEKNTEYYRNVYFSDHYVASIFSDIFNVTLLTLGFSSGNRTFALHYHDELSEKPFHWCRLKCIC